MNVRNLCQKESCGLKFRYNDLGSSKGKYFANARVIKELFWTKGMAFNIPDIEAIIDAEIDSSLFQTEREKNLNSQLLTQKLMRLKTEMLKASGDFLKGEERTIELYGEEFEASFHFQRVNKATKTVDICYVKNKKKDLKQKSKFKHNTISQSMELFLLQKVGEEMYPTYRINGCIYYLAAQEDRGGSIYPYFDRKSQEVTYHFWGAEKDEMEDRLKKVIGLDDTYFPCEGKCEACQFNLLCNYQEKELLPVTTSKVAKAPASVTFTDAQDKFIHLEYGTWRVLAGAGSGKTTCIANRIIELLDMGYLPEEILLITYTTKGVEELKEKIDYWLHVNLMDEDYPIDRFQIFTFNGFGYELIKLEYRRFGFTGEPKVLDKYENMKIIKKLLDDSAEINGLNYEHPFLAYYNSKGAVLQVDEWFKLIKTEELIYPEELEEVARIPLTVAKQVLSLYKEYETYYKDNNFLDFNDQVELLSELFDDKTKIEEYGFKHIMVDEYQDSDNLQTEILKKLLTYKDFKSFVVVGDDSQAIYSWRGATSENIIKFDSLFPLVEDIEMVDNFRSTKQIINLANNINNINTLKVPKQLRATRSGDRVELFNGDDILNLCEKIEEDIKDKKLRYVDIALISRNKKDLLFAQNYFAMREIPTVLATSELLIDNQKILMLIDFAKYLVDNSATLGFAEYCKLTDYEEFVKHEKKDLAKYLGEKESELWRSCKNTYFFFLNLLTELGKEDKAINKLKSTIMEKGLSSMNEIAEFLSNMKTFQADYYIEKSEEKVNAITLTTAHSSKGREWNNVYVYLNKFKYPKHYNYYASEKNSFAVEEERRLLFVAITRAKNHLTLLGDNNSEIYKEVAQSKRKI